jgi:hypothetical protein
VGAVLGAAPTAFYTQGVVQSASVAASHHRPGSIVTVIVVALLAVVVAPARTPGGWAAIIATPSLFAAIAACFAFAGPGRAPAPLGFCAVGVFVLGYVDRQYDAVCAGCVTRRRGIAVLDAWVVARAPRPGWPA